jgi:hypothetical protein
VVRCLNPYELIRKYRCDACAGVMMCGCEESFARRFLPHQLAEGTELETQRRVAVTLSFQPAICTDCRGLPAIPTPVAQGHGRTSKIRRYYWRELFFEEQRRFADWVAAGGVPDGEQASQARADIGRATLDDLKASHAASPRYTFAESSRAEVLHRHAVQVVRFDADYVEVPSKGRVIQEGENACSPEIFVTRQYEAQGLSVTPLESVPLHALFGVFMWLLVQDPVDPLVRVIGFGERTDYETRRSTRQIWTSLPEDFGSRGYAQRRATDIERHFAQFVGDEADLLWLFDYWRPYSADLRQYLWAHRQGDVDRARRLVEILPKEIILRVLRYLVGDYWNRFCGWPDLLIHGWNGDFFLAEVKSSGDKLREDQKRWVADNDAHLHLPFRLVKIHRRRR